MTTLEVKLEIIFDDDKPCLKEFSKAYSNLVDDTEFRETSVIRLHFGSNQNYAGMKFVDIDDNRMTIVYMENIEQTSNSAGNVIWKSGSYIDSVSHFLEAVESKNNNLFNGSCARISWNSTSIPMIVSANKNFPVKIKPITKSLTAKTFRKNSETIKDSLLRIITETVYEINNS